MEIFTSTRRLILREIIPADEQHLFKLDSDPEVHRYLGGKPVTTPAQAREMIQFIRRQYRDNGIGRWAVIEKATNTFIGWAGLKLITEPVNGRSGYYDLGYRLMRQHWGKGYATEAARAVVAYGFERLQPDNIYAMANAGNTASRQVLEKTGFRFLETFEYENTPHHFFGMAKPG